MLRKSLITVLSFVLACALFGNALPALAEESPSADGTTSLEGEEGTLDPTAPPVLDPGTGVEGQEEAGTEESAIEEPAPEDTEGTEEAAPSEEADLEPSAVPAPGTPPLAPGNYRIYSAASRTRVIDIVDGSIASGANVQLYQTNNTQAQFFTLTVDAANYYTIKNVRSGNVLDVQSARAESGANVWQYTPNGSTAQKWILTKTGDTYTITSALAGDFVLDVAAGSDANGANIRIYHPNNTAAQKFYILPIDGPVSTMPAIPTGFYQIASSLAGNPVIDIAAASRASGVQLQIYTKNNTAAQLFEIKYLASEGFYSIKPLISGQSFDVAGASTAAATAVQQYANNNTAAQRWSIVKNADGTLTFIARQSGLVLDVENASPAAGSKLQTYFPNGTAAQKFSLTAASTDARFSGYVSLIPYDDTAKRIDIAGGSRDAGANVQAYTSNNTLAQKFVIAQVPGAGASTYSLQALNSGHFLTASGTNVDQRAGDSGGAALASQQWVATWTFGGVRFVNPATNKAMALVGTDIALVDPTGASREAFEVLAVNPIHPGYYFLNTPAGLAVDVMNASTDNGANVQVYSSNATAAQKWGLQMNTDGSYTILSARSKKALDIANGSATDGTNVRIYTANSTAAQKWTPIPTGDGYFYLRSGLGTYLAATGGGLAGGSNIYSTSNSAAALKLSFTPTSYGYSGNADLDEALDRIKAQLGTDGDVLRKSYNYVAGFRYITGSTYPSGDWSVPFALEMYRNSGGNCYRYAALFCWLAIANGYDARVVSGEVPRRGGGWTAHGWVEIRSGGQTYIYDPDMAHAIPSYNWYMQTYASAPISYRILTQGSFQSLSIEQPGALRPVTVPDGH